LEGLWKTKVTLLCVGLIVGAFAVQGMATPNWQPQLPFGKSVYLGHGGYLYEAIRDSNEWWRFLTGVFVARHGLSALIGAYLLFQLGGSMERILGSARTFPLIVLSGVGGLALADLWFPARQASGPFVVGFALLGALPGVVLGITGSFAKTAKLPAVRSAIFSCMLWIAIYWFISFQFGMKMNFAGLIGGVLSALVVGFALGLSRRDKVAGLVALVLAAGAVAFPAVMVCQGKRYLDGKLVLRGKPAGSSAPRKGPSKKATAKKAENARVAALDVLDRFGKVPYYPETGEQGLDNDQAAEVVKVLKDLDELADGTSMVTVEVEDLRARAHLLLGQGHAAREIAYLLVGSKPTPPNRALYGASLYASQEYEKALEVFQELLSAPRIDTMLPEVHYYTATSLFQLGRDEESQQSFGAYLSIVSDKPMPDWRKRFVARAKKELGQ
jgi:membrane associated rhomboid family serine protease